MARGEYLKQASLQGIAGTLSAQISSVVHVNRILEPAMCLAYAVAHLAWSQSLLTVREPNLQSHPSVGDELELNKTASMAG